MMEENKIKILIVEDDEALSKILEILLKAKGYEVYRAENGVDALSEIKLRSPDLILLDINLPKLSGFEIAKIVKNDKSRNIPIIMITALGQDENIKRGYELGCEDYITKPFNVEQLALKIEKLIKEKKK